MTPHISPDMTLLDIVGKYRETEPVFRSRDDQAGECLLCRALFDTVAEVAARYNLDLDDLLSDLERAVKANA